MYQNVYYHVWHLVIAVIYRKNIWLFDESSEIVITCSGCYDSCKKKITCISFSPNISCLLRNFAEVCKNKKSRNISRKQRKYQKKTTENNNYRENSGNIKEKTAGDYWKNIGTLKGKQRTVERKITADVKMLIWRCMALGTQLEIRPHMNSLHCSCSLIKCRK